MSDIAQGSKVDLVLAPGDVYQVGTVGVATVVPAYGAPAGTTTLNAETKNVGPFNANAKVTINAVTGRASYNLLGGTPGTATTTPLGPFTTTAGLPNDNSPLTVGRVASVGATAPYALYDDNGSAWVARGGAGSRALFTSRALTTADSGAVLEVAAGATVTVPPSLGQNFSCAMDVVGGTLNIARSGAATLNGAATTLTRAARQLISISQTLTGSPNDYTVTGV